MLLMLKVAIFTRSLSAIHRAASLLRGASFLAPALHYFTASLKKLAQCQELIIE
jgi:hypothetical protein